MWRRWCQGDTTDGGVISSARLRGPEVNKLKIDRTFIRALTEDPEDQAILTTIIGLAKTLGMASMAFTDPLSLPYRPAPLNGAALTLPIRLDPGSATLRTRLREATRPAHARLEARLNLLDEPVPADRIMHLLQRFHGFHSAWEPALEGLVPTQLLQPRLKLPLLEADMRSLGAEENLLRTLPACPHAASLCSGRATAAGSLYVLEGSTLGGAVINPVLAHAPWYPMAGLRYWNPYGNQTGKRWKETLAYLESLPASWSDEVIQSANMTFDLLRSWLPAQQ